MNLFNQKFIQKQIAVAPTSEPTRQQALAAWAQSIKSGRVASLKETALHGEFLAFMVKAFGYSGAVGNEWETWIGERRAKVHSLNARIRHVEDQINSRVFQLFNLTTDEIALLEARI